MNRIIKFIKKYWVLLVIIIIFLPFIIYREHLLGFINNDLTLSLIGYYGSIIGGSLTLVGVVWTIRYEKESQIEGYRIQYKPFVYSNDEILFGKHESSAEILNKTNNEYESKESVIIEFNIINSGRGEAINVEIIASSDLFHTKQEKIEELPSGAEKTIRYQIYVDNQDNFDKIDNHKFDFTITYYGAYDTQNERCYEFTKIIHFTDEERKKFSFKTNDSIYKSIS